MIQREPTYSYSLRDVLTIVFKHKYKIVFPFVSILVVTAFIALSLPVHYVAKAAIMIKPGREFAPSADVTTSELKVPALNIEAAMNTEMQILTSYDLVAKVVSSVGVYNIYPDLKSRTGSRQLAEKSAIDRFITDVLIKPVKGSNVIEIFGRNANPQIAAKITNTLVELLKDKHLQVFGETRSPFIEEQLKLYGTKYAAAVNKLSDFKEKNQITSIKDQYWWIIGKRTELEATLKIEESKLDELRKKVVFLKSQKKKAISDLYTATVGAKLVDLEAKETQLLATYKENSRPVINVRKEIQKVKDALRQYEEEQKESQEWASLEADIGPQELKVASLRQQFVRLDKQLASLTASQEELSRLEREVTVAQSNYETYSKKHEEARIADDLDKRKVTNIQVIEAAAVPINPVKANQRKILGMGFFLAVAVGFGLAYLAEYLPQGITNAQGVTKHLRIPVLVAVSYKMPRR